MSQEHGPCLDRENLVLHVLMGTYLLTGTWIVA